MKLNVSKIDIWVAGLKDVPGALTKKLSALSDAGANVNFVLARRKSKKPGTGVVFLSPLTGAKVLAAARKAGFRKTKSLYALRVEGADKRGLGACITGALAEAGINLRGMSAAVIGRKFVLHVALDNAADATKAARVLKKI